jgi:hypothetical protein
VGTPGEKITLQLKAEYVRKVSNRYGKMYLVSGLADEKNIVKFFVDNDCKSCFNQGQVTEVKGFVEYHQENKIHGGKETILYRVDAKDLQKLQNDPELT